MALPLLKLELFYGFGLFFGHLTQRKPLGPFLLSLWGSFISCLCFGNRSNILDVVVDVLDVFALVELF